MLPSLHAWDILGQPVPWLVSGMGVLLNAVSEAPALTGALTFG
jgi:hypothetical protein